MNVESLTGKTDFGAVRDILRRLEKPEGDFQQRIHLISASAMMSHGVDVDRLNTMVMIGLPLGAAEFIQASARVGRRWPGIVFVVHRLNREREAGVYRCFGKFIQQADRFVEAIPITRRSRNVLERTLPGLAHSRILHLHEPRSGTALTTPARLRAYRDNGRYPVGEESAAVIAALGFDDGLDEALRDDVREWFDRFDENIRNLGEVRFVSDLLPGKLMTSLRDVEEQVPVYGQRRSRR